MLPAACACGVDVQLLVDSEACRMGLGAALLMGLWDEAGKCSGPITLEVW